MLRQSIIEKSKQTEVLRGVKCWLLDMDGTVTLEEDILPGALDFFSVLKEQRFIFVTNNSSHSANHYIKRMNRIGIPTNRENVLTSTDALISFLKKKYGDKFEMPGENEDNSKRDFVTNSNKEYNNSFPDKNAYNNFSVENTITASTKLSKTNENKQIEKFENLTEPSEIRVFPIGTPDFEKELTDAGMSLVKRKNENIDAVLLAFDTTLMYEKLDIACDYIRAGVPYFVANPDKVCPIANGKVLPDCGAILAFMETCTGVKPLKIIGKPNSAMIEMVIEKYGYSNQEIAMVGDRIYTDLAFAKDAGILCVAVLTGEATMDEIIESDVRPDFVFDKVGDLAEFL